MNASAEFDRLTKIPRRDRTEEQNARVRELAALLAPQPQPKGPAVKFSYVYNTANQARRALRAAEKDVAADQGEEMVDAAWGDIVRSVTDLCKPSVRDEILRGEGMLGWFE